MKYCKTSTHEFGCFALSLADAHSIDCKKCMTLYLLSKGHYDSSRSYRQCQCKSTICDSQAGYFHILKQCEISQQILLIGMCLKVAESKLGQCSRHEIRFAASVRLTSLLSQQSKPVTDGAACQDGFSANFHAAANVRTADQDTQVRSQVKVYVT